MTDLEQLQNIRFSDYIKLGWPLRKLSVNQPFGTNYNNFYQELGMKGHNGIDYKSNVPEPIYACFDGEVVHSGANADGGIEVKIASNYFRVDGKQFQLRATYYHLQSFSVSKYDVVKKGQKLGITDNTGRYTTGAHLHFGIKPFMLVDGKLITDEKNGYFGSIDPQPLLEAGWDLLPVDNRYSKPKNWLLEYMARFKTPEIHLQLIKLGRHPLGLTDRELKARVYGNWSAEEIFNPALFPYWSERVKK